MSATETEAAASEASPVPVASNGRDLLHIDNLVVEPGPEGDTGYEGCDEPVAVQGDCEREAAERCS